jgi:hypothetical protein
MHILLHSCRNREANVGHKQSPETEKRLILSVLKAHSMNPPVPWGITQAGWHYYDKHWSEEVRAAVAAHPYRFKHVSKRVRRIVSAGILPEGASA